MNRTNFNQQGRYKPFGTDLDFINQGITGPLAILFKALFASYPLVIVEGMQRNTVNEVNYLIEYDEGWALFNGEIVYFPAQSLVRGGPNVPVYFYIEEVPAAESTRTLKSSGTNIDVLFERRGKMSLAPPAGVQSQQWDTNSVVPTLVFALIQMIENNVKQWQ